MAWLTRLGLACTLVTATARAEPPAVPATATPQVRTVATIGADVVITDEEVWQMVRQRLGTESQANPSMGRSAADQKQHELSLFREELRGLIERELILAEFLTRLKKNNARMAHDLDHEAKEMAKSRLALMKKQLGITTDEQFHKVLAFQGISPAIFSRHIERNAMLEMYLSGALKDAGKAISMKEVERFYADHQKEFAVPEKIVWLDLFVSHDRFNSPKDTELYANWLLDQVKAGADVAELVEKYGHGDSTLRKGVGIGTTAATIRPLELAPAVVALKPGEPSGLVPTELGIHILKVTERQYPGVRPFDREVQALIRAKLEFDAKVREKERLVESLWRKTTVSVVELP